MIMAKDVLLQKFNFLLFFHHMLVDKQLIIYLCIGFKIILFKFRT